MIAGMSMQEFRERLDSDQRSAKVLAQVVCRTCWSLHDVIHFDMDNLDTETYSLAWAIIHHRHTINFFDLACWCRERHGLAEWADAV